MRLTQKQSHRFCSMKHLQSLHNHWLLSDKQPHFSCYSKQIQILSSPIDFYITLHKQIRQANRRIVLSSLYLGTGNLEKYLVQQIDNKIKRNQNIRITTVMDYNRSMRRDQKGESGSQLLNSLKQNNLSNKRVNISYFKQPNSVIQGMRQVSGENLTYMIQEVMGTHHVKLYIFDDNVIITGANLSASYFTDRYDRWMLLQNVGPLADYLEDSINCIASNSIQLDSEHQYAMQNHSPIPALFNNFTQVFKHHFKMFLFGKRVNIQQQYQSQFGLQQEEDKGIEKEKSEQVIDEQKSEQVIEKEKRETLDEEKRETLDKYFREGKEMEIAMNERKEEAREILEESFDKGDVANIVRRIEQTLYQQDTQ